METQISTRNSQNAFDERMKAISFEMSVAELLLKNNCLGDEVLVYDDFAQPAKKWAEEVLAGKVVLHSGETCTTSDFNNYLVDVTDDIKARLIMVGPNGLLIDIDCSYYDADE